MGFPNKRPGRLGKGGTCITIRPKYVQACSAYRGRLIRKRFWGEHAYRDARRWYVGMRNLKLKETRFWYYMPHLRVLSTAILVKGYRPVGGRRIVKRFGLGELEKAIRHYHIISTPSAFEIRARNLIIPDEFSDGWSPQPFEQGRESLSGIPLPQIV